MFQHQSRAISVFQKDLVLECSGIVDEMFDLTEAARRGVCGTLRSLWWTPRAECFRKSPELKIDSDLGLHLDWFALQHVGLVAPLLYGLNGSGG